MVNKRIKPCWEICFDKPSKYKGNRLQNTRITEVAAG